MVKKLHSPAAMWTRISAPTKPPHTQVIYDIEIDDNFYYMHFRLNLRNKIVDYSPHFFLCVVFLMPVSLWRCHITNCNFSLFLIVFGYICSVNAIGVHSARIRSFYSCLTMFIFFDFILVLHSCVLANEFTLTVKLRAYTKKKLKMVWKPNSEHRMLETTENGKGWTRRDVHSLLFFGWQFLVLFV